MRQCDNRRAALGAAKMVVAVVLWVDFTNFACIFKDLIFDTTPLYWSNKQDITLSSIFLYSIKVAARQWRIAGIVYFLQLCLALTVGMQVYDVMQASIGHSLEINKLLQNYDHTVVTDFLKVHGASITPLIGQLRWLLLAWLLFSVFTDGGVLYCVHNPEQASGRTFWQSGATYFFPFLKISLFFLVLALLWTALLFLPIAMFFQPSLQFFSSEKYAVWLVLLMLVLWLLGFVGFFIWSVLSRLQYLETGGSVFVSIREGWRAFRKNKASFWAVMASFIAIQLLLIALYFAVEALTGMTSTWLILFVFVVQQLFVFYRIQIRQLMYAGIARLYVGRKC